MNTNSAENRKILNMHFIILACFLGLLSFLFPYSPLFLILILVVAFILSKLLPHEDKLFLMRVFWLALLIRLAFCIAVFLIIFSTGGGGWVFGDEWGISERAWKITQFVKGAKSMFVEHPIGAWALGDYIGIYPELLPLRAYGSGGYTYWVSLLYFFYGYAPLLPKILNALVGALLGIFAYLISQEIFTRKVARLSAILVSFFPSMIFWSILNLKDTMFIVLLMIIMLVFIKFQKTSKAFYLIPLIIMIALESTLRREIWIVIPVSLFFSYIILLRKHLRKTVILFLLIGLLVFIFLNKPFIDTHLQNFVARIAGYHIGHVNTAGISYKILPDKYYLSGANLHSISFGESLQALFKAWFYFMLAPFPWSIQSKLQLFAFPQIIMWYFLVIFALVGILLSLRYKVRITSVLLIYLFLMTTAVAVVSGNVGTTFRHRDILTPFYLIFSAAGIVNVFKYRVLSNRESG